VYVIKQRKEEEEMLTVKQLYTARIEIELMIIAESAEDARRIASRSLEKEASNVNWTDFDADLSNGKLAADWFAGALPYGKHEDKTVGEWIDEAVE